MEYRFLEQTDIRKHIGLIVAGFFQQIVYTSCAHRFAEDFTVLLSCYISESGWCWKTPVLKLGGLFHHSCVALCRTLGSLETCVGSISLWEFSLHRLLKVVWEGLPLLESSIKGNLAVDMMSLLLVGQAVWLQDSC